MPGPTSPSAPQSSAQTPLRAVQLYTDGACSRNPGPGGWAFVLRDIPTGRERECSGAEPMTTNNRMEMMAVIQGLSALKRPCRVELYSDSKYVLQGLESWMAGWKRNGWRRRSGSGWEPVKNAELWQQLDRLMGTHQITFHYIPGHTGHPENERCDELAVAAYKELRP